jgi:shikimate dehydrogenase
MKRATVIGWPIAHSRSPLIHGYWLKKHKLDGSYDRVPVEPAQLGVFIQGIRHGSHVGTNVTLPHKEAALSFIDEPDDRVRRIESLNTIWRENGKLCATSTDGPGFMANLATLQPQFDIASGVIVILGAGGSTRAIVDEALRRGATQILIHNRTASKAHAIADHFGQKVKAVDLIALPNALQRCMLLINTTSAGISDTGELIVPWQDVNAKAVVSDITYTPLITPFLKQAQARDHDIVPGLGMLLHQAVDGFEKWFGQRPDVTADLYDLVAKDVDPDYMR